MNEEEREEATNRDKSFGPQVTLHIPFVVTVKPLTLRHENCIIELQRDGIQKEIGINERFDILRKTKYVPCYKKPN